MNNERMTFSLGHHGGMPTAQELKWRRYVEKAAINAVYYPEGREPQPAPFMGKFAGSMDDFQTSRPSPRHSAMPDADYLRMVAKYEHAWNTRME